MTTIKEVLVAALKLETLNDFFIDQNNLTIKLKDKTATVLFENSLKDNNCEDKVYLKDLHNLSNFIKSVFDCNFSCSIIVIEKDNSQIKILA